MINMLDFLIVSFLTIFFSSQIYISYFPTKAAQEVNLSMVWCALAVGFSYKILMSLTGLYFEGEEAGERSIFAIYLCICLYFLSAFIA